MKDNPIDVTWEELAQDIASDNGASNEILRSSTIRDRLCTDRITIGSVEQQEVACASTWAPESYA